MPRARLAVFWALALGLLAGCGEPTAPVVGSPHVAASATHAPPSTVALTLLYTSDEHGWIAPQIDGGTVRGGAAELLYRLVRDEGHCPFPGDRARCPAPSTVLLSGGDNYTGPAISTYFGGEPMAEAMEALGYTASAFGNHELDFGRAQFATNRARAKVMYLGANVHVDDPAVAEDMRMPGFLLVERRGVKIGVVGLATESTLTSAMASRFKGVSIEAEETALERVVPEAWAAGADAVVLIAHECVDKLAPLLDRHPEFDLSFAFAAHCHRVEQRKGAGVPIAAVGWRFEHYLRVRLSIDPRRALHQRVIALDSQRIDVRHDPSEGAADVGLSPRIARWQTKLDQALGEEIGFAQHGFDQASPELAYWLTEALRSELGTDVAILNTGGIRQSLPQGPITQASLWSILPFDNKVLVLTISGRDLVTNLKADEATFAGVIKQGTGYRLSTGAAIDPSRKYTVATIDYLYFGGSKFRFQAHDPAPRDTGLDWRAPILAWTRRAKTTSASPIEAHVRLLLAGASSQKPKASVGPR